MWGDAGDSYGSDSVCTSSGKGNSISSGGCSWCISGVVGDREDTVEVVMAV